jgi:quercetin dioxygenase-like cupin family protein
MRITRTPVSTPAPEQWITGPAWIDSLATPAGPSRTAVDSVHFGPGARTRWHRHPVGQVLVVTAGTGRVQRRGGPVEVIGAGDAVRIEPGEWHWHGAGPGTGMTHLAIEEAADGAAAEFGEPVTEAEYHGTEPVAAPDAPVSRVVVLDQALAGPTDTHRVQVRRITIAPNQPAGPHVHNGPVFGSVETGSVVYQVDGQPPVVLGPGATFHEPAGTRIDKFDAQDAGVTFLAYFLLTEGQDAELTPLPGQ